MTGRQNQFSARGSQSGLKWWCGSQGWSVSLISSVSIYSVCSEFCSVGLVPSIEPANQFKQFSHSSQASHSRHSSRSVPSGSVQSISAVRSVQSSLFGPVQPVWSSQSIESNSQPAGQDPNSSVQPCHDIQLSRNEAGRMDTLMLSLSLFPKKPFRPPIPPNNGYIDVRSHLNNYYPTPHKHPLSLLRQTVASAD